MDETSFRAALAQDGFDEVLVREWPSNIELPQHHHAWDARLLVLRGELRLTRATGAELMRPGQSCELPRQEPHAENYGPDGCTLLVGRRYR